MIIAASLDEIHSNIKKSGKQTANADQTRRVTLSEATIGGHGVSVLNLNDDIGPLDFAVTESFFNYLGKGNRVLFRLRDLEQVDAVIRLAYDYNLSFEFDRTAYGVSIILFKRSTSSRGEVSDDDGIGI